MLIPKYKNTFLYYNFNVILYNFKINLKAGKIQRLAGVSPGTGSGINISSDFILQGKEELSGYSGKIYIVKNSNKMIYQHVKTY